MPTQERAALREVPKEEEFQPTSLTPKAEENKKSLDEVADEIDDVLKENAEEFVRHFVWAGGE